MDLVQKFIEKQSYLKKGAPYLAGVLNVSIEEVYEAKEKARLILHQKEVAFLEDIVADQEELMAKLVSKKESAQGSELTFETNKPLSPEEIDKLAGVDNITREVALTWLKSHKGNTWTYSISVRPIKAEISSLKIFTKGFTSFLKTYTPKKGSSLSPIDTRTKKLPNACLVLPKQDAHFNKYDINGNNDIKIRFKKIEDTTKEILQEVTLSNHLEKITYIVGSDQFNSEWTGFTTKGTPQQNILDYQDAFKAICDHEVNVIEDLLVMSDRVEIVFVPGNHDEYVGWHIVNWLKVYYREDSRISINEDIKNSKFERYSNSAIMYNHGDAIKPADLISLFPIKFREEWSKSDHFYIFTGDKHHELALNKFGIAFYQVPALSGSVSKWDDKKGFDSRPEMQAFLIREKQGLSTIYKRKITL